MLITPILANLDQYKSKLKWVSYININLDLWYG